MISNNSISSSNKMTTKKHEVLMGKYELGRLLGRGTFAKVYHARSLADDVAVAVKVLDKPDLLSSGAAPLILREVSAMRRLSPHPNILRLHEVMATKSKIYLVTDFAPGGDLLSLLRRRRRPLPEPSALRFFHQLISALRFAHSRGVSHRDVKPDNLLLDRSHSTLLLADFGLSALRHSPDSTLLQTACGTPAYTSPEVVRRKGYDGAKADAWSCGVILYVLLAGFLPFDDSNLAEMYKKMCRRDFKIPSWFSPSAKKLISGLLDPNPNTRVSVEGLTDLPLMRRAISLNDSLNLINYMPLPSPPPPSDNSVDSPPPVKAASLNAFDIILMSAGLDLSGLFEDGEKEERRFTSRASLERILERVEEVWRKLGFAIERKKGAAVVGKGKWGAMLTGEVLEVAAEILLVEVKIEGENNNKVCWEKLRDELGDIVAVWHMNGENS